VARIRSSVSARVVHRAVLEAGDDVGGVARHLDHRRPGLLAGPDEGVVVGPAVDEDPLPAELLGLPPATGDPLELAHEMAAQGHQEPLGRPDAVLLREGVHGVLLGVGRHHLAVVADGVARLEVPAELGGDVEVLDVVHVGVPGDPDDADLGLAVLVRTQDDVAVGHVSSLDRWCRRTG
jgi:hypothetical protein